ncbi:MAG: hypothetical protein R3F53_21645 [Gammaproteobacteria bacterium]
MRAVLVLSNLTEPESTLPLLLVGSFMMKFGQRRGSGRWRCPSCARTGCRMWCRRGPAPACRARICLRTPAAWSPPDARLDGSRRLCYRQRLRASMVEPKVMAPPPVLVGAVSPVSVTALL